MEVKINKNMEVVNLKRGTLYAGSVNTKIITLTAEDNVFSRIPKTRRLIHVNLTREDGEQSGWMLMDTIEDEVYFYKCQKWDLSVPGELEIVFKLTDTETEEELTTAKATAIVKDGAIAQPACPENHSALESYYYDLSRSAFRSYNLDVIDTYPITYKGDDDYKTPRAIYLNFKHSVPDAVNSTAEMTGSLMVTSFVKDNVIYQTETFYARGLAWSRELKFNNDESFTKIKDSEFIPLGVGLKGEKGNSGKSFIPLGEWSELIGYANNEYQIDTFYYGGVLYYTKKTAPKGTLPTNDEYFGILVQTSKLYNTTGLNENGSMTQKAETEALATKLDKNFGIENAGKIPIPDENGNLISNPWGVKMYKDTDGSIVLEFPDEEVTGDE